MAFMEPSSTRTGVSYSSGMRSRFDAGDKKPDAMTLPVISPLSTISCARRIVPT